MNANLLSVLKQITAQHGEDILENAQKIKSLFGDFAKDEPKPLRMVFGKCVENGFYRIVKNTKTAKERREVIDGLALRLRDEEGLDIARCTEALELLAAAIFGEGQIAPPPLVKQASEAVNSSVRDKPAGTVLDRDRDMAKIIYDSALFKKLQKLVADKLEMNGKLKVDEDKITLETSLRQDLGLDSLDLYELVYACEEELGIAIPDEKANRFNTMKDVFDYIVSELK